MTASNCSTWVSTRSSSSTAASSPLDCRLSATRSFRVLNATLPDVDGRVNRPTGSFDAFASNPADKHRTQPEPQMRKAPAEAGAQERGSL